MVAYAVSVVVPTCGRPALLDRCLRALSRQRPPPAAPAMAWFEVIVVDDRPQAQTAAVVRRWMQRLALRGAGPDLVYLPNRVRHGPAAARNLGWRAARAPLIAFTDDDTVARPDWLAQGLAAMGPWTGALCGKVVMPLPPVPSDYARDASRLQESEFVTANCFCRRAVLTCVGGFDERFRMAWREDSDLHFRLLDRGVRVGAAPLAVVRHPIRPAFWGVSVVQQKKMLFDALLQRKHPRMYRQKIRPHPRWDYHLILALLVAAAVALAAGATTVALFALAGWAAMTARLCLRRLRGSRRDPAHVAEMALTSALIPLCAEFWRAAGVLRFGLARREH